MKYSHVFTHWFTSQICSQSLGVQFPVLYLLRQLPKLFCLKTTITTFFLLRVSKSCWKGEWNEVKVLKYVFLICMYKNRDLQYFSKECTFCMYVLLRFSVQNSPSIWFEWLQQRAVQVRLLRIVKRVHFSTVDYNQFLIVFCLSENWIHGFDNLSALSISVNSHLCLWEHESRDH